MASQSEVAFRPATGVANKEENKKMLPSTPTQLASLSKTIGT